MTSSQPSSPCRFNADLPAGRFNQTGGPRPCTITHGPSPPSPRPPHAPTPRAAQGAALSSDERRLPPGALLGRHSPRARARPRPRAPCSVHPVPPPAAPPSPHARPAACRSPGPTRHRAPLHGARPPMARTHGPGGLGALGPRCRLPRRHDGGDGGGFAREPDAE